MASAALTVRQRLARHTSTLLLMLAVFFVAMWVLSIFQGYAANAYTEVMTSPAGGNTSHQRAVASSHGRLWFAYVRAELVNESARHTKRHRISRTRLSDEESSRYDAPAWLALLGIDWRGKDTSSIDPHEGPYVYQELFFTVPYWLLILTCGGLGWWIGRKPRLIRRRQGRGLCVACGYDVRATRERCPECGYVRSNDDQRGAAASASA
jgi:hypothetical protein